MKVSSKQLNLVLLHVAILIFTFSVVFVKYAALTEFFSFKFFLFYSLALFCLGVYAIFWQQMLRHFKLSFAYINRAAAMLWTVLFGILLFGEKLSITHIIGIVLIIGGIVITVTGDE